MKKKSIELLLADIFATFFTISLITYLYFVASMLLDRFAKGETVGDVIALGHLPALILHLGCIVLFVAVVFGWISFFIKNETLSLVTAVSFSLGLVILIATTISAYIEGPVYSFVSLLFTVFYVPSVSLTWFAYIKTYKKASK